jgi:hypothetical protein
MSGELNLPDDAPVAVTPLTLRPSVDLLRPAAPAPAAEKPDDEPEKMSDSSILQKNIQKKTRKKR